MVLQTPLLGNGAPRHIEKDNRQKYIWGVAGGHPPFHGARSSRETKVQNESFQMGGREVTGRKNCFFLLGNEWSRSYKVTNQHPVFHEIL